MKLRDALRFADQRNPVNARGAAVIVEERHGLKLGARVRQELVDQASTAISGADNPHSSPALRGKPMAIGEQTNAPEAQPQRSQRRDASDELRDRHTTWRRKLGREPP